MRGTISEKFWAKVDKTGDCWEWTGNIGVDGYGRFFMNKRFNRAHRMSYELTYGQSADGLLVCHRCDNPRCVRPDHLFLGTNQDNSQDKISKGRQVQGERHYRAKLTDEQVREIRRLVIEEHQTQTAVSEMFGISNPHVSHLVRGIKRRAA